MTDPEVSVKVNVEPVEETPAAEETGAVEDALALVEHVEEDVDKWVANERDHNALELRIHDLEMRPLYPSPMEVAPVEEIVEEAVAEAVEEIAEEVAEESEPEVEVDIPPVEEEVVEKPGAKPWDVFSEIHAE